MLPLFAGVLLVTIPCNVNWSMINNDTLALFKVENGTNICVDFKDIRNTILKYHQCYDFNEAVVPHTVFQYNNTIYVVAKSLSDNSTMILLSESNKLKLFTYKPEMLRFNHHAQRLVDFNNQCLEEYDIGTFLYSVINNLSMEQTKTTYIFHPIEDYQFYDNNTIYYFHDGHMFIDAVNQLFYTESKCLQLLLNDSSCKADKIINPDLSIQIICALGLISILLFVFTGSHLKKCWQKKNFKKPFPHRKTRYTVPQKIPIIRKQKNFKDESELSVLNSDM